MGIIAGTLTQQENQQAIQQAQQIAANDFEWKVAA